MTDRDTFAAAALTGLLADDGDRVDHAMPNFTARAYEWADAMLRERASQSYEESDENRTNATMNRGATPAEGSVRGEGAVGKRLVTHVSLSQSLLHDNEKLRAEIDQLREAIRRLADQDATLSVHGGNVTVTLDATLTDEEREAIAFGIACVTTDKHAATLRRLLERLT